MKQSLLHTALVVRDYDDAIAFFCKELSFRLVEDTYQPEQDKRLLNGQEALARKQDNKR